MKSLEILTADYGWAWSPKRITVSTVGLKKNLRRYLDESECHLAVSLHSPIHEQRLQLMPAEKQFAIADIVALLKEYDWSHQRRITFEYILFGGINDTPLHSKELAKLLKGLDCRVNLIRWHKIPGVELNEVEESQMINFRDYLNNHGITCTIRASRGQDIYAACGLLSTKKQMENK
jgi:23S rRNA (adenine2503-C2)-methyltransferase